MYTSLGDLLGVGDTVLEEHADMVRTMIGLLDGRVYYNLNAWFGALALSVDGQQQGRYGTNDGG